jgi:hypothetical protein
MRVQLEMWASFFPKGTIFAFDLSDFSGVNKNKGGPCTLKRTPSSHRASLAGKAEKLQYSRRIIWDIG